MSSMSRRCSSVTVSISFVTCRSTGEPRTWMRRMLTSACGRSGGLVGRRGADGHDARDARALDDDACIGAPDRDAVGWRLHRRAVLHRLLDVHHLADDAAGGDDFITALHLVDALLVLLPLLLLR